MEELTSLLNRGADIECKNALGQTPLHIAVDKGNDILI
jgi:ankyrin repeat protein